MSKKSQAEKYLLHSSGVLTMLAWLEQQKTTGVEIEINEGTLYLSNLASRYFALGKSPNNKAKLPFLAIQPNESQWINMIEWDYIAIRENESYLYLVSKLVIGDNTEYPDLPPFSLAIAFDNYEKLDVLKDIENIDAREYFVDSDNAIRINHHSKIFSVPLKFLDKNTNHMSSEKVTDIHDIMLNREEHLQSVYMGGEPEFKGELSGNSEDRKLFDKLFGKKEVKKWF